MKAQLTSKDIKELKHACRPGIILAIVLTFLGIISSAVYYVNNADDNNNPLLNSEFIGIMVLLIFTSFLLGFALTRKFFADIKNGEKEILEKTIQKKHFFVDYEAGSGSMAFWQKMKAFDSYNFIIEGVKYQVTRELYEQLNEGDKVFFHQAPISEELLKIDIK